MSQVTYNVGIMGSDNSLLYSGTLLIQIQPNSSGGWTAIAAAGLLSLKSFDPLLLGTFQGATGPGWYFTAGNNAQLSVANAFLYQVDQGQESVPALLGGSITLSVSGQQQQTLSILGILAPSAASAGRDENLLLTSAAPAAVGVDTYNYKLTLLDDSFAPSGGGGQIQATGQWVKVGVVGRRYEISGTLTLDQLSASIPVSGFGGGFTWTVNGTEGNNTVVLTLVPGGAPDGSLTINGKQYFFVGSAA